eukprot:CAMPEP_0119469956 /NCGR_PEP_ID=MMETSP1344-20130328/3061_1 /TAXON_ID=236787 /ORGANISM="Florenciella parvula, Strain CCMP2471" /LENGTH=172 /DNA_ID=CAMNT_0007502569 /DNA_START=402 /DNA_END=918 /DNA_ORIENTATION=-
MVKQRHLITAHISDKRTAAARAVVPGNQGDDDDDDDGGGGGGGDDDGDGGGDDDDDDDNDDDDDDDDDDVAVVVMVLIAAVMSSDAIISVTIPGLRETKSGLGLLTLRRVAQVWQWDDRIAASQCDTCIKRDLQAKAHSVDPRHLLFLARRASLASRAHTSHEDEAVLTRAR